MASFSQRGAARTSMKYRMMSRPLMKPSTTTATVMATLGTATPSECPGASHHDTIVIVVSTNHA